MGKIENSVIDPPLTIRDRRAIQVNYQPLEIKKAREKESILVASFFTFVIASSEHQKSTLCRSFDPLPTIINIIFNIIYIYCIEL